MSTPVMLMVNERVIPAVMNDTHAARDFMKRLPFHITMHRYSVDYCGTAASGEFDPAETQNGWKNGDISLAGGWFALLFDGEEASQSYNGMMIIGHIDERDLPAVRNLSDTIRLTVALAE